MRVCSCNAMEKAWLRRTQERVGGTGPGGGGNQTEIAGWRGSWTQAQIPPLTSPDSDAGPSTRSRYRHMNESRSRTFCHCDVFSSSFSSLSLFYRAEVELVALVESDVLMSEPQVVNVPGRVSAIRRLPA